MVIVVYVDGAQEFFTTLEWSFVYADKLLVVGDVQGDHEIIMADWVRRVSVVKDADQIELLKTV